jgi:D-glycero-D-manno-heptose 1,7-bisphosphate phosphatase
LVKEALMAKKELLKEKKQKKQKAVFLDRDGVLNYDVGYLNNKKQLKLLPGVEKIKQLEDKGYLLIIFSNQSVVARGLATKKKLQEIDELLKQKLKEKKIKIRASYYCPHHPDFDINCQCRKPKPGMVIKAIKDFNINPEQSIVIGDKISDLQAGYKAGVRKGILVKRNGQAWDVSKKQLNKIKYKRNNIAEAVKLITECWS